MKAAGVSISSKTAKHRNTNPLIWQSRDDQIHFQTNVRSQTAPETSSLINTRFQSGRVGLSEHAVPASGG